MCGIGAIFSRTDERIPGDALENLLVSQRHRGPDGEGSYIADHGRAGLSHTRLAIQDLSPRGAQPMRSACGRFALVFNGEIYNHDDLRAGLTQRGVPFTSSGDAETLLALLVEEGERALPRLNGMFALAFYDSREHSLLLARDAFGQKPLYWSERGAVFALASECRALVEAGLASSEPDPIGVASLVAKGSVAWPHTHLRDVHILPPGTWMRVSGAKRTEPIAFWQTPWSAADEAVTSFDAAVELIAPALLAAAKRMLVSDVPVGAFLSGGIDSSVVCALMRAAGARDLRTFNVSLPGTPLDESRFARQLAAALDTEHTEVPVNDSRGKALVAEADARRDVPSIDGVNSYIVAKVTREAGCKVAVSGVGGDELFGGYPSFRDARRLAPLLPRHAVGRAGARAGGRLLRYATAAMRERAARFLRIAAALEAGLDEAALYCARRSLSAGDLQRLGGVPATNTGDYDYVADVRTKATQRPTDSGNRALDKEQRLYMTDQLLRDADQFGMAHALEIRALFLDTELAAAMARVAGSVKAERGFKRLLVAASEKATGIKLPREIVERPKAGFHLPLARWRAA